MDRLEQASQTATGSSFNWLLGFGYLQFLDILTTIAFLLQGVAEANPMVRWTMFAAGHPLWGLLYVKCLAVGLGWVCWRRNKRTLLTRVTLAYAALVAWNLVALVLASARVR